MSKFQFVAAVVAVVLGSTAALLNAMLIVFDGPSAMRICIVLVNVVFVTLNVFFALKQWPGRADV